MNKLTQEQITTVAEQISCKYDTFFNGNHLFYEHAVSDKNLQNRIKYDGKDKSSKFDISEQEIIELIKKILMDPFEQELIMTWFNKGSNELFADMIPMDKIIGHGFKKKGHDWSNPLSSDTLALVLTKATGKDSYICPFKLVTAYPAIT